MPEDKDKWAQYVHEDKADRWEQYTQKPKSLSSLSSEPQPRGFYGKHPYVSEGILGAASGVGIPESKTPVRDIGKGLAKTFEYAPNELDKDPLSKVMSYVPVLGPVYRMGSGLGEQTYDFSKDIASGDPKRMVHGAAGMTTEALSLLWGAKKGKVENSGRVNRIATATGEGPRVIEIAEPDLVKAAERHGKPKTAAELRDLTQKALDMNRDEFDAAIAPIKDKKVSAIPIADAIKAKIKPEMMQDPAGRKLAKQLLNESANYNRPWRLQDLLDRKKRFDAERTSFYKKSPSGQAAVAKTSVDEMVDSAFTEGARSILYPEMDKAAGKPAGYFEALQKRQSALIDIKDSATKTVAELEKKDAMIKGLPLSQKLMQKFSAYLHPLSGRGGVSLHKLNEPLGVTKLDFANKSARTAFASPVHPTIALEGLTAYINHLKNAAASSGVPVTLPRTQQKDLHPLQ